MNGSEIQSAPGRLFGVNQPASKEKIAQQEALDYWSFFWRGVRDAQDWDRQHRRGQRRPIFQSYTVPKRRSWTPDVQGRDHSRPRMHQYTGRLPRLVPYYVILGQNDPQRLWRADGEIISGENPIMTALNPLGFRFRKTLGQGGEGIAMLVDLLDKNGKADQWVIKAPIGNRGDLTREAQNMRLMVGARHVVQRKFIKVPDRNLPSDQVILNTDSPDCNLGMELLKHGSLDGLIRKISAQNLKLRDDELWMIFHCLFRACVAMSRPGTWSGGFNPERDPIPLRDEDLPLYGPVETASSILHFDLDPDNILIGDYEADPGSHTHETVPIFKIGDLGIARRLNEFDHIGNDMVEMIYLRRLGKVENLTPEQFTQEWDYLAGPPNATNEPVAGNYSWKSNLYAVGNVMWMLMTHCCTRMPPSSTEVQFRPGEYDVVSGRTYGCDLFTGAGEGYQVTLRSLVIWCMMHDPASRPDFHQLEHMILGNIGRYQTEGDPNTEGRTSIRDILTTPRPPPPLLRPARVSSSATLAGSSDDLDPGARNLGADLGATIQRVRLTSNGWEAYDAGIERTEPGQAVPGMRRSELRAAARNVFRAGGLRNLAQRAGRGIRRVFGGAVRKATGSGGPHRQSRLGSATVARPADQQVGGGVRDPMADLEFAMASVGLMIPRNMALGRRRQAPGANNPRTP